ncbi:hypothetical protein BEN78_13245 [Xanthomonas citri pv. mangiferaeindicae]|nr:hypothetical protein BEN78_13245 [Xanthomonas citri pv. mangiferaeindicae]
MVALVASATLAYGYMIGGLYLIVYWGRFGLRPFQHGGAADMLPAGVAAMAVTLVGVFSGAWVGTLIGKGLAHERVPRWVPIAVLIVIALGFVSFLIWGPAQRFWVIAGIALVFALVAMIKRTIALPEKLRAHDAAMGIAVVLVYAPMVAAYIAHLDADRVVSLDKGTVVDLKLSALELAPGLTKYAGRLQGETVVYQPCTQMTWIVPASAHSSLALRRGDVSDSQCETEKQAK